MTAVVSPSEVTTELRMPPAVAEWLAEQGLPPIDASKFERGRHRLDRAHDSGRLPNGWPWDKTELTELGSDDLYYDAYAVIRPKLPEDSAFRRHAARHTKAATA